MFKHPNLGFDDIRGVAIGAARLPGEAAGDWLMVADIGGRVLVVPLARPYSGDATKCRPIGCYETAPRLAPRYREDR